MKLWRNGKWVLIKGDKVYHEHSDKTRYPIDNFRCTSCGEFEPRKLSGLIAMARTDEPQEE